jgi:hypothetical protein
MYNSKQAALDGESFGGSGFLVGLPVEGHEGWSWLYAITNRHVLDAGYRFIRLNNKTGGVDVVETARDDWHDHPDRFDVSAHSLDLGGKATDQSALPITNFITRDIIEDWDICPGDEAFLVGRLITPWGQQRNIPAVRFGNISMMADPNELAIGYRGVAMEVFDVECRSLSGFSGSPVFCSTTRTYSWDGKLPKKFQDLPQKTPNLGFHYPSPSGTFGPWFLGIDWGHLPLWKPVFGQKSFDYPKAGHWVEQATGIACVLPAWHILDLLMNEEDFVKERQKDTEALDRRKEDSAVMDVEIESPLTKAGFEDILEKVSRKTTDSLSEPESEKKSRDAQ